MSERNVTFRLKLVNDSSNREEAEKTRREAEDVEKKLAELEQRSKKSLFAVADGFKLAAEGAMTLARGAAFLGAAGEKDLRKFAEQLARFQGLFDTLKGSLDFLKGISKAYEAWTTSVKATTAANELLAASNMKVAASGRAAAASGMGGGGIGRIAGLAGAGIGAYAGYQLAESQGWGPWGTAASTVGGAAMFGAGAKVGAWGIGAASPYLSRGASWLGTAARGFGAAGAVGTVGTVATGLAAGESLSRLFTRGTADEGRGTLSIGAEAFGLWRQNRARASELEKRQEWMRSDEYTSQTLALGSQKFGLELDAAGARSQFDLFQRNLGVTDARTASQNAIGVFQTRGGELQTQRAEAEAGRFGGGDPKEQARVEDEIRQIMERQLQLSGQITQQRELQFRLAQDEVQQTQEKLRLAQEEQSSRTADFGRLSRAEQRQVARAVSRFETGDRSEATVRTLERFRIESQQTMAYREQSGREALQGLGIERSWMGDLPQKTEDLSQQLKDQQQQLQTSQEQLSQAQKSYHESQIEWIQRQTEQTQKFQQELQASWQNER